MYQAIRELAPKQPYRRVQIRDIDGTILNPSDAADRIRDWLAELYHDDQAESVCPSFSWPFSAAELEQGLLALPAVKALAPGYAPSALLEMRYRGNLTLFAGVFLSQQ